ncbi:MAG TPA: PAS domain S-box protein [Desulfobacterales bacterium]|nr:PAS domain S-box protein [Desulfobacterales bacterium]
MADKPNYEKLERKVKELEKEVASFKKIEASLRESEATLKSLFRSAPTDIGMVCDRVIQQANERLCNMTGYTREELMGKTARILYATDEDYEYVGREKYAQIRERNTGTVETRWLRKDGTMIDVLLSSTPIDPNDLSIGVTFTALDITTRKQVEKDLRESEERYKSLFKNNHSVMLLIDPETADIVDANPAAVSFYDYSYGTLIQKKITDINTMTVEQVFDEMKKAKMEQRNQFYFRHRLANGEIRDVEVYSGPIKVHGRELLYSIVHDISERKKAEEEKAALEARLLHAQKMESIGTLSGGIAHDFNNLLGIILGNVELAMDDVPKWHPAKLNLNEIRTASLRARDVVKQLLSFSRKTDHDQRPVNLIQIVNDALKFLRSSIPTSIEIHQNMEIGIDDTILADNTQINQVMVNLCTNAAHAMEQTGGVITIDVENISSDQFSAADYTDLPPGRYVKLNVSDTGTGIDPEIVDRIFDPYFTTKELGKGTGIGLSVVHGIVKSHSGAISVDSTFGKGTTFSILFPLAEEAAVVEPEPADKFPTGNESILIVDDEKSMVDIGRKRLERLGYQVEARINPLEALELFRADPGQFDLVITDMTMPHITGDKFVKEILKIRPDIPTILCTGFSEKIDEKKAREIGIRGYIEKPFDKGKLSRLIREVLDHP